MGCGEIHIKQYVCVLEGGGGVYEIFFEGRGKLDAGSIGLKGS